MVPMQTLVTHQEGGVGCDIMPLIAARGCPPVKRTLQRLPIEIISTNVGFVELYSVAL